MKLYRKDLLLYAVTDRAWTGKVALETQVEQAILGGATIVQLREKNLGYEEFLAEAMKIKAVCRKYKIPFIINDNVGVAVACGADGVHVGQSDVGALEVRKLIGADKILGVSVTTASQAVFAYENGADCLGVGAMFETFSKSDADVVTKDVLKQICASVSIPVVAIGGITEENIEQLAGTGIAGVALISAIFGQSDIERAAKKMLEKAKKVVI